MPPKGKGGQRDNPLEGKDYQAALQEVFKNTAARANDVDPKAVQLLDALQAAGKADEACTHLSKSLEGVTREKVENWKAYVFTLLRAFDTEVYNAMKEARGRPKPRRSEKKKEVGAFNFRTEAAEFVPGQSAWAGAGTVPPPPQDAPKVATNGADTVPDPPAASADAPAAKEAPGGPVFQVECKETSHGEVVGVVGSAPEIGSWDPTKALTLSTSEASYPVWKSEVIPLAADSEVEYKFIVLGADKAVSKWEPIEGNRKFKVGGDLGLAVFGSL